MRLRLNYCQKRVTDLLTRFYSTNNTSNNLLESLLNPSYASLNWSHITKNTESSSTVSQVSQAHKDFEQMNLELGELHELVDSQGNVDESLSIDSIVKDQGTKLLDKYRKMLSDSDEGNAVLKELEQTILDYRAPLKQDVDSQLSLIETERKVKLDEAKSYVSYLKETIGALSERLSKLMVAKPLELCTTEELLDRYPQWKEAIYDDMANDRWGSEVGPDPVEEDLLTPSRFKIHKHPHH